MKLENLLEKIEYTHQNLSLDQEITNISTDSRKVQKGSLYISLPGTKTDGQNFINQVIENGVTAVTCSQEWLDQQTALNPQVSYIAVKDRRKAFAQISSNFYHNPTKKLFMIGVTGTNGKTTTTHLIENILKEESISLNRKSEENTGVGIIGTLYSRYGNVEKTAKFTTPMADELHETFDDMIKHNVSSVIMEFSSHALQQARVGSIDYSIAVFTNLTQDHLDYHPTFEDYKEAKGILFKELLKEDGSAIINYDDPSASYYAEISKGKVVTYGLSEKADIYATDIVLKMDGTTFTINYQEGKLPISLNLVGKFNVYNTLASFSACYAMNIPVDIIKTALEKTKGISGRIEIVTPQAHPYTVVVDYAHTPDSLENILKSAREFTKNRLICVFGCGGDRDRTKRPIMGGIAEKLSDIPVVTSDNPRTEDPDFIIGQILEGINNKEQVLIEVDRRLAIKKAIETAKEGDTVVIAGKGHEDYQIFKDKTIHFDDREVAREFIKG